jgi:DNA-binding FadR family transcriptional regulator
VAFAAVKATEAQRELIRLLAHQPVLYATPIENLHANRRLHQAIYSSSGNSVLARILDTLWDRSDRYRMVTLRNDTHVQLAHHEHESIADAVISGNAETASRLMREHVGTSLQRIRSEPRPPR